jgi:hypothetical protein
MRDSKQVDEVVYWNMFAGLYSRELLLQLYQCFKVLPTRLEYSKPCHDQYPFSHAIF